jgi:hypothetical protein
VENPDSPKGNPFADEMQVNFNMFDAFVLNGVAGEVDCANIVIVDEAGRLGDGGVLEEAVGVRILQRHHWQLHDIQLQHWIVKRWLSLRGPRDKASSKRDCRAGGRATGVRAAGPIGIRVNDKLTWRSSWNNKTEVEGAKMSFPWVVHMQTDLLNGIG